MSDDQEIDRLREDVKRLQEERNRYRDDLRVYLTDAEALLSLKLKTAADDLGRQIEDRFFARIRNVLWIAGVLLTIGTLGGLLTFSDLVSRRIDDAIEKRTADFANIREKAVDGIVDLQSQTRLALEEVKRLKESAKMDIDKASGELQEQREEAKRLILETTRYWKAAKPAIERAAGRSPPGASRDGAAASKDPSSRVIECLVMAGVKDPDVQLFHGVLQDDTEAVKKAMEMGGNPVVTVGEITTRHRATIQTQCPGLLR